jgi:hypothetical protein
MISLDVLNKVIAAVRSISSSPVPLNWWTEFSSWQDFRALLSTGNRLSIHTIVENLNHKLEAIENVDAYVETIDENGNIEFEPSESTDELLQVFTIKAKRKKLRRLKEFAAYNAAKYLSSQSDVENLQALISLRKIVNLFVVAISGDYIFDLNENRNKRIVNYWKICILSTLLCFSLIVMLTMHAGNVESKKSA